MAARRAAPWAHCLAPYKQESHRGKGAPPVKQEGTVLREQEWGLRRDEGLGNKASSGDRPEEMS